YHFIRDAYEKKLVQVLKIHIDDNVVDLLTKAFDVSRESLGRALDGTEALMLPKLFILWLAIVSTDSAELVPMGKVSTAIETLKKNTAKDSSGGNLRGFRSSKRNSKLEGTDQEAQEASQTCYHTPQSIDEECLLTAKIGRKKILKEKLDAQGECIQTGEEVCQRFPTHSIELKPGSARKHLDRPRSRVAAATPTAQQKVSTDKEKVSTDRPIVSTDGFKVSTDKENKGTDEQIEGIDDQAKSIDDYTEGERVTQTTQTHTSTIFGDDETIAQVLINMSQAKEPVSRGEGESVLELLRILKKLKDL
ncbi:hypothetical protein Tco_0720719, partial [Tanacetum coccineum]